MQAAARQASFAARLQERRVIAGVKEPAQMARALAAGVRVIFYLTGTIYDVAKAVRRKEAEEPDALLFCHVDLIQGLGKDEVGVRFLAQDLKVDGILTTRRHLVQAARDVGLLAIQRVFMLDSEGLRTALGVLKGGRPDAIEILPALVVPHIAHRLPWEALPPAIAGGLVETRSELEQILATPVKAVSTSREELWAGARRTNK
ncbi:glycerol-3-phosphate responsive antiterminator [Limnochorda pilosa]|uniref:Glycerol-3-phosphate responsive antiterminator GlpP n=1 Tax=Limnochorda pilosa TaxID=1555112 RepID=A0A0K2SJP1_LIMPI|nr:glycerol-3-phosphate responsive antiterminator [Limnochorda pilosa]BAS27069.1 glycerol-3-phosphate responsive antiterminator GlpP [Limnochorda pilosa]